MTAPQALVAAFLEGLGAPAEVVDDAFVVAVERAWREARETWPTLDVDASTFAKHLGKHMLGIPLIADSIERVRSADLLFALACSKGDRRALDEFRRTLGPVIAAAAGKLNAEPWFVDEVRQQTYQKLLVSQPQAVPRIAEYSGRGPIEAWVRVSATRLAIDLRRKESGADPDDDLLEDAAPSFDPELDYIRLRYADTFEAAFRDSFQTLSSRERNVLRMYLIDGLDIGRIGTVYHVHRATIARWISRARETLIAECHRLLSDRLGATDSEVDSLVRFVRSQVRVNLVDALATQRSAAVSEPRR